MIDPSLYTSPPGLPSFHVCTSQIMLSELLLCSDPMPMVFHIVSLLKCTLLLCPGLYP